MRQTRSATLTAPTNGPLFDFYFVENTPGEGTVKPESFDSIFKVGSFTPNPTVPNQHTLNANIGTAPFPQKGVNFDLDLVVVELDVSRQVFVGFGAALEIADVAEALGHGQRGAGEAR